MIKLVENGYNVNLVELTATKRALGNYGLRDRLVRLAEEHENFLLTDLWKKHAHVYEFLRSGQCFAELTDSGSMQEELNHIDEALCFTARYNTDRPETVFEAGTNLLVPPTSGDAMYELVSYVAEDDGLREQMRAGPAMYGENVGETIVEFLAQRRDEEPFEWAHERVGFTGSQNNFEYL